MSFKIEIPSSPGPEQEPERTSNSTPVETTSLLDLFTTPPEKPESPEKTDDTKSSS